MSVSRDHLDLRSPKSGHSNTAWSSNDNRTPALEARPRCCSHSSFQKRSLPAQSLLAHSSTRRSQTRDISTPWLYHRIDSRLREPCSLISPIGEWFYSSDKHVYSSAGLAIDEQLLLRFDEFERVHSLWLLRKCTEEVNLSSSLPMVERIDLLPGSTSSNEYDAADVQREPSSSNA